MIKYIVFDFDGTLADTFTVVKSMINLEMYDMPQYSTEDLFEYVRNNGIEDSILKFKIPLSKLPHLIMNFKSELKKANLELFPDIIPILKSLYKEYRLGILSSNSKENIVKTLKKYNVEDLFDFIYSDSSLFGKHIVMKKMCEKFNLKNNEVMYVGDEDRDILAAKKLNIKMIAVSWGFNSRQRLLTKNPDYVIDLPIELLKILI